MNPTPSRANKKETGKAYVLDEQIGFLLRQATQRHLAIFSEHMVDSLTPTQFSALLRLYQLGPCSQNLLGRRSAMDAATIKGVIDRLAQRGLTENKSDKSDGRLMVIHLTAKGRALVSDALIAAERITSKTLKPLSVREQASLLRLLKKLC
jgi:DNA-binding MarR family transcriptional regulator